MSEELKTAIEAAKKGAEKALYYFGHNPKVLFKPDHTPVTKADQETESIIKQHLLENFTTSHFVGEETGGSFDHENTWIIDPIDGTKNFIRGLPFWSILIAKYVKGEITLGVSYTPQMNELIYAEKGHGAFRNGEKITVSKISGITDAFMSYPGNPSEFPNTDNLLKLISACMGFRGFGDAFAYQLLANGRIDINLESAVKAWDVAPFKIIIEEAGGKVTNLFGKPWAVNDTTILATNGTLHDEVIEILNLKQ